MFSLSIENSSVGWVDIVLSKDEIHTLGEVVIIDLYMDKLTFLIMLYSRSGYSKNITSKGDEIS